MKADNATQWHREKSLGVMKADKRITITSELKYERVFPNSLHRRLTIVKVSMQRHFVSCFRLSCVLQTELEVLLWVVRVLVMRSCGTRP